jgi:hypothetical protein
LEQFLGKDNRNHGNDVVCAESATS